MKVSKSSKLRKILSVRTPKDYPWQVLHHVVVDLRDSLSDEDYKIALSVARSRDIKKYLSLSDAWSPQSIGSSIGMRSEEFIAKYQIAALLKKFQFPTDSALRRTTAKEKFLASEVVCGEFNRIGAFKLARLEDEDDLALFTYARSFLQKLLGPVLPDRGKLTYWSRHGPGASLDTTNRNTSLYFKYKEWPYSCTDAALGHARLLIEDDERWLGALEDSYRARNNIPMHSILDRSVFWESVFNRVDGNRITFVPKNSQTDRSIAIEPAMNLCLQLGVDGFIRRRLKRWGVDLDSQTKNQILAGVGSRCWDSQDSFVTLDLAAASDSVTTELCRLLLPPQWYNYLMEIRSPFGELDGETISYEKISSMGNGYTFALESAIFTAVVYAATRVNSKVYRQEDCAIFGDDIIVRKDIASTVVHCLNLFGFTINDEKSFQHGYFRESCGSDWFRGIPVRPVFLSTSPSTVMEVWSDLNRIKRFMWLRRGVDESESENLISSWIPAELRALRGPYSDTDFDSYRHSHKPVAIRYRKCLWEFSRLVITLERKNGREFLFRKLMHPLRPNRSPRSMFLRTWGGARLETGQNVFEITKNSSVIPCVTSSLTSYWSERYVEAVVLP